MQHRSPNMQARPYANMSAAEKRYRVRAQPEKFPMSRHTFRCEHCGVAVTAQDAAGHASRCSRPSRR